MGSVDKIPWPKIGDKPFKSACSDATSSTWCSLDWMSSLGVGDSAYAEAFKEAGDKIVSELEKEKNAKHPDMYFFPIAYLYRHCWELQMKSIIELGAALELIHKDDYLTNDLKTHNLHCLWNEAKQVFVGYWPEGGREELAAAERIVLDFHKIDQTGQGLRYSRDMSGAKTAKHMPSAVQLLNLRDISEKLYNFFDACETGLYEGLKIREDMLHDCVP
jgi:hypothetical protein